MKFTLSGVHFSAAMKRSPSFSLSSSSTTITMLPFRISSRASVIDVKSMEITAASGGLPFRLSRDVGDGRLVDFHLDVIRDLDEDDLVLDPEHGRVNSADRGDFITLLHALQQFLPLLLPLLLRTEDHEVENQDDEREHDQRADHASAAVAALRRHQKEIGIDQ